MQQSQYETALPVRCAHAFLGFILCCRKAVGSMSLQYLPFELEFKCYHNIEVQNTPKIHIPVTFQNTNMLQCLDHLLSHQTVVQPWSLFHLQRFCSHLQSLLINHHYWLLVLQLHFLSCNPQCLKEEHKSLSLQNFWTSHFQKHSQLQMSCTDPQSLLFSQFYRNLIAQFLALPLFLVSPLDFCQIICKWLPHCFSHPLILHMV